MSVWIKICGITREEDAKVCHELGVDAMGLNFARQSSRALTVENARSLARTVRSWEGEAPALVGVFVDHPLEEIVQIVESVGLSAVQLHGEFRPDALLDLSTRGISCFQAFRVLDEKDVEFARSHSKERLLVDAKVPGSFGGTGKTFDWSLVSALSQERELILAGGLVPENVAHAIAQVRPFGVDTASGVESRPGEKSPQSMRRFVENARAAAQ